MYLRRREDKNDVGGRLLKGLEQGIECPDREHMHLVDDINSVFCADGREICLLTQVTDIVNAVVAGGVYLDNVENGAVVYPAADLAFVAGIAVDGRQAVDRL